MTRAFLNSNPIKMKVLNTSYVMRITVPIGFGVVDYSATWHTFQLKLKVSYIFSKKAFLIFQENETHILGNGTF